MVRVTLTVLSLLIFGSAVMAGPAEDAVTAYREYLAAINSGSVEEVMKRVEPVSQGQKPLVLAYVEGLVAVEAVKTEMARQMGPEPEDEEEGWNMGQLPDRAVKNLKGEVFADDVVRLTATDPLKAQGGDPNDPPVWEVGAMLLRDGRWVLSVASLLGPEVAAELGQLPDDQRNEMLAYYQRMKVSAESVLERLKKKEFTDPVEVQEALIRGFMGGE